MTFVNVCKDTRLWPARKWSIYGKAADIPFASGSYPGVAFKGFTQTIWWDTRDRRSICSSRISVSESELDSYLILQKEEDQKSYDYDLSHILLPITSRSGEGEINRKQEMIIELRLKIEDGETF